MEAQRGVVTYLRSHSKYIAAVGLEPKPVCLPRLRDSLSSWFSLDSKEATIPGIRRIFCSSVPNPRAQHPLLTLSSGRAKRLILPFLSLHPMT